MSKVRHPIEGQIVLVTGAQASVTLEELSTLLADVHENLAESSTEYTHQFERIEGYERVYYMVEADQWQRVADNLGLSDRELAAVKRAHREQFLRTGRRLDRKEEFETALEIRDPVVFP